MLRPSPTTRVTVLMRREIVRQAYDVDQGWWGTKYLHSYAGMTAARRMEACRGARARGVAVFCMPVGMARRVANTTFFDRRRNVMRWRVEWTFHAAGEGTNDDGGDEKCRTSIEPAATVSVRTAAMAQCV